MAFNTLSNTSCCKEPQKGPELALHKSRGKLKRGADSGHEICMFVLK